MIIDATDWRVLIASYSKDDWLRITWVKVKDGATKTIALSPEDPECWSKIG